MLNLLSLVMFLGAVLLHTSRSRSVSLVASCQKWTSIDPFKPVPRPWFLSCDGAFQYHGRAIEQLMYHLRLGTCPSFGLLAYSNNRSSNQEKTRLFEPCSVSFLFLTITSNTWYGSRPDGFWPVLQWSDGEGWGGWWGMGKAGAVSRNSNLTIFCNRAGLTYVALRKIPWHRFVRIWNEDYKDTWCYSIVFQNYTRPYSHRYSPRGT